MERVTGRVVVDRIREDLRSRGRPWAHDTVDTAKTGDLSREVHGIATAWMATADVVHEAAAAGCDFLVTHEPTFWNHLDLPGDGALAAPYRVKRAAIEAQGITVWRFHDHHHSGFDRDPVLDALFERLGWLPMTSGASVTARVTLAPVPAVELAARIGAALGTRVVRVVGDPRTIVRRVAFGIHDLASSLEGIRLADAVVVGELREWDAFEYFRDAGAAGAGKILIVISHAALERWAATGLARWLGQIVPEVRAIALDTPEPYALYLPVPPRGPAPAAL